MIFKQACKMLKEDLLAVDEATTATTFAREGVVHLAGTNLSPSALQLATSRTRAAYEGWWRLAARRGLLAQVMRPHAEVLDGFYMRQGGRIDFSMARQSDAACIERDAAPIGGGGDCDGTGTDDDDGSAVPQRARFWEPLVRRILGADCVLEYAGCVTSRPGDADQNWHIDGLHRSARHHLPCDRLNVFVPLVDLTPENGCTEMVPRSHVRVARHVKARTSSSSSSSCKSSAAADPHDASTPAATAVAAQTEPAAPLTSSFEEYACRLPRVRLLAAAGEALLMDYRVWHRGLANTTAEQDRPLLYFKYRKSTAVAAGNDVAATATTPLLATPSAAPQLSVAAASAASETVAPPPKKRKRIAPLLLDTNFS